jgi:hypothetical protein
MELFSNQVIESTDLPPDEAWIIFNDNAPQVPQNLRGKLPVPCILTGDEKQAKRTLNLLRAITLNADMTIVRG